MIGNDLLDGWTVTGTETTDDSGATFPATGPMVYRLGSDSPWDVVSQLCEQFIDVVVDAEGRTLRPFVKGRQGVASTLELVAGYSTAGLADPGSVNVTDLEWDIPRPEFDALVVRWARGRFNRGAGSRWGHSTSATSPTSAPRSPSLMGCWRLPMGGLRRSRCWIRRPFLRHTM